MLNHVQAGVERTRVTPDSSRDEAKDPEHREYALPRLAGCLVVLLITVIGCNQETQRVSKRSDSRQSTERFRHDLETRESRDEDERSSAPASLPAHPRLLVAGKPAFDAVRSRCETDPTARDWLKKLTAQAAKISDETTLPSYSKSMQKTARQSFADITTCAGIYRLTADTKCLNRAKEEMLAIADFADWQPTDFIVTAEMMAGMSLGYDWLFDDLSAADRTTIRRAIVTKGVRAGLNAYKNGAGWTTVRHNWNFVSNGGLILAALATADDDWADAHAAIDLARDSMSVAIKSFAPDGGWEEGPSYWNYATRFAVYGLAALETSDMPDNALASAEGFDRTGLFRIYMQGPTGRLFNFADCDEHTSQCPQLWWMAEHFKQPALAAFEAREENAEPAMLDLLWYRPVDRDAVARLPASAMFRGVAAASLRSGWNDHDATYVAIKGGWAESHHGHLDLGSFVLDALGQRWAIDLGADDYSLPGYGNGAQRWTYYRCRTEGHNTLTINNANQELKADARLVAFRDDSAGPFAVIDLTSAYPHAERVVRGVKLLGRDVWLQDEIQIGAGQRLIWAMHARADVSARGTTATLQLNNKAMTATILSPTGAKFDVVGATASEPQGQQPDVRKLVIRVPTTAERTTIVVLFHPNENETSKASAERKITTLRSWIESAGIQR